MFLCVYLQDDCEDDYQAADVQSGRVGLPADGPQKAVHFLDGADLLAVLLLRVFGSDCNFQASVRFSHRLHLRVLPQIDAVVLQLLGAVCAYECIKGSQNLHKRTREDMPLSDKLMLREFSVGYLFLTHV